MPFPHRLRLASCNRTALALAACRGGRFLVQKCYRQLNPHWVNLDRPTIKALAVLYSPWCFFWSFWPQSIPITATGFNWALVIFVSDIAVALVYYMALFHKH